jgi:predicted Zn-ribbon and HTH transcriptional regulator
MPIVEIKVKGFRCERCGHEWVPRDIEQEPKVCPKCKSPYWNTPRRKPVEQSE